MPRPGSSASPLHTLPSAGKAACTARDNGCVDHAASDEAMPATSSPSPGTSGPIGTTPVQCSVASVSVPVLSTNSRCTRASPGIASRLRSSRPSRAIADAVATSADGAASDSAHGQVTTSTETTTHTTRDGSMVLQAAPAPTASSSTAHRNGPAQRSAAAVIAGRCERAARISAAMASARVSAPTRSTRMLTGAPTLRLPATTASPSCRVTGRDSPVSSDSSARVQPSTITPSAAKASPCGTRTRSPTRSSSMSTGATPPAPSSRSTVRGTRAITSSSERSARWRARISSQRPPSRKLTNIVIESKYTSRPNRPPGAKAAPVLAAKATRMPSDTGTSMPMRRWRSARHAPPRKGAAEKHSTGSDRIQLPQSSRRLYSGDSSPGALK